MRDPYLSDVINEMHLEMRETEELDQFNVVLVYSVQVVKGDLSKTNERPYGDHPVTMMQGAVVLHNFDTTFRKPIESELEVEVEVEVLESKTLPALFDFLKSMGMWQRDFTINQPQ